MKPLTVLNTILPQERASLELLLPTKASRKLHISVPKSFCHYCPRNSADPKGLHMDLL